MALTILVDLDDTLLGNKMEVFIPAYLQALGKHLANEVTPETMVASMLVATQSMFDNKNPAQTLKSSFDEVFYPKIGISEEALRPLIQEFYKNIFPTLQKLTQVRSGAKDFIKKALERGYKIGIATNPVFPKTAIDQRLKWAGLNSDHFPYELVPAFETFHFAKPEPAFFAEFLTQIGWPEEGVIMVGNDLEHDILGSHLMGIASFWINQTDSAYPADFPKPLSKGSISEVLPWIDSQSMEDLIPKLDSHTAIVAILRGTGAGLETLLSRMEPGIWRLRPGDKEWSLTEIICHLRDVEREINLPRLEKILTTNNPFIPGVDSDKWAEERNYQDQNGPEAFESYLNARMKSLEILESLGSNGWQKELRHAIFGPTHLGEIARFMAMHEILHCRQTFRNLQLFLPPKQTS